MTEKILIESEHYNIKKVVLIIFLLGLIVSGVWLASLIGDHISSYEMFKAIYFEHQAEGDCGSSFRRYEKCYSCQDFLEHPTSSDYAIYSFFENFEFYTLIPFVVCTIFGLLFYFCMRGFNLTVTDKRIYGNIAWGKRVDLPVDSVTATSIHRNSKGISVSTASGRISFNNIKNAEAIYTVISNLLIERQEKKINTSISSAAKTDDADQLEKFKNLLDKGIITQEEFDAKKKQLLGL